MASISFGLVLGVWVGVLRSPDGLVGGRDANTANLRGYWISQGMGRSAWIDSLLVTGVRREDIDAFLAHDPFSSTVHYEIEVTDDRILISAVFDEGPVDSLSGGPYRLVGPSTFRYDDVGCYVTVHFDVSGDWLSFDAPTFESCDADERIANRAFFNPWPYTRGEHP